MREMLVPSSSSNGCISKQLVCVSCIVQPWWGFTLICFHWFKSFEPNLRFRTYLASPLGNVFSLAFLHSFCLILILCYSAGFLFYILISSFKNHSWDKVHYLKSNYSFIHDPLEFMNPHLIDESHGRGWDVWWAHAQKRRKWIIHISEWTMGGTGKGDWREFMRWSWENVAWKPRKENRLWVKCYRQMNENQVYK